MVTGEGEREKMMGNETELLTIQQVMSYLHVADETVYRYIRSGKLKAIRVGGLWRVSREALGEFLREGEQEK